MFLSLFGTQEGKRDPVSWTPSETPAKVSTQADQERVNRGWSDEVLGVLAAPRALHSSTLPSCWLCSFKWSFWAGADSIMTLYAFLWTAFSSKQYHPPHRVVNNSRRKIHEENLWLSRPLWSKAQSLPPCHLRTWLCAYEVAQWRTLTGHAAASLEQRKEKGRSLPCPLLFFNVCIQELTHDLNISSHIAAQNDRSLNTDSWLMDARDVSAGWRLRGEYHQGLQEET